MEAGWRIREWIEEVPLRTRVPQSPILARLAGWLLGAADILTGQGREVPACSTLPGLLRGAVRTVIELCGRGLRSMRNRLETAQRFDVW